MSSPISWLHISDIHFNTKTQWRDSISKNSLIEHLDKLFKRQVLSKPDFIFCTGDIAFGEVQPSDLENQYKEAQSFFDNLLAICGNGNAPLSKERLYIVPGNHDVNRNAINPDAQETLKRNAQNPSAHVSEMNQRFNDYSIAINDAMKRLNEYGDFVQSYLVHQSVGTKRHNYTNLVRIKELKIGIAGFNSSWSCAGPEDDRSLWMASEWQFNKASEAIRNADLRIGLIHHPIDWLNESERLFCSRRISTDFHFWLHGHSHNPWVIETPANITISAGAVGAGTTEEFGINFVQLNINQNSGSVHLYSHKAGGSTWTISPVEIHAPEGIWSLKRLPSDLDKMAAHTSSLVQEAGSVSEARSNDVKLFGREALIKDAVEKLLSKPVLLVYGLRGIGKTSIINELGKTAPLADKQLLPLFSISRYTSAKELFQKIAIAFGDRTEFPQMPSGDIDTIAEEIIRRYPSPPQLWIWIDRAHQLLEINGFRDPGMYQLLHGLILATKERCHWIFELRERPPLRLFESLANRCEVPGLNKISLSECLTDAAPDGQKEKWTYTGKSLKWLYQWLGGGYGEQAHPLAIQLLILIAIRRNETPWDVHERNRQLFDKEIEEKLLNDLYHNVLNTSEQTFLKALALYRFSIPHDHADCLENSLSIPGAWDGIDRRCLLTTNSDQSLFFLHCFIADWLRTQFLGYEGYEDDFTFSKSVSTEIRDKTERLHSAIASCWLTDIGNSSRATSLNIARSLEAFHHLVSGGDGGKVQKIAIKMLTGNESWALSRIETLYNNLYKSKAPVKKQREALEYWAALDPDNSKVHRFLGSCWQKELGKGNSKAVSYFEKACELKPEYPSSWAALGSNLLAQGKSGAKRFIEKTKWLEANYPKVTQNDYIISIKSNCLDLLGKISEASSLRMDKINIGSTNTTFYNSEAKALLKRENFKKALEILDIAEKNHCIDDYTTAIRADVLQKISPEKATAIRMEKIKAGTKNPVFYCDEAKVRIAAGDHTGALEILDLAGKNHCPDSFTDAIRADVLQKISPEKATVIRMEKIKAGTKNPVFYCDEAKVRMAAGDYTGALEILDLAEKNHCPDNFTDAIRAEVLQKESPKKASELRMTKINSGTIQTSFYCDEAKARMSSGDHTGALEILNLAEMNGCANDYSEAMKANVLQKISPQKASELRMTKINAGTTNEAFYCDEAKARMSFGDHTGALKILDLAEMNGCANDYSEVMKANVLQKISPQKASELRMAKINTGTTNSVFYCDEARAKMASGDNARALEILESAEANCGSDKFIKAIKTDVLKKIKPD